MDTTTFGGSCACGRITYKCSSNPLAVALCHCITCRKLGGGSYQVFVRIDAAKISFHDHKDDILLPALPARSQHGIEILALSTFAERAFCVDCHTPLGMRYKHSQESHSVTLGSVDEDTIRDEDVKKALVPGFHIFTSQKAWWCEGIGRDGLGKEGRFTGRFEEDIRAWEKKSRAKL